jgi:hypothetical protein
MKPKKLDPYQKAKKVSYELGYAKGVEDELSSKQEGKDV